MTMTARREQVGWTETDVLTVREAACYLKLNEQTVRLLCGRCEDDPERIPNVRFGTAIRIPFWGLLQWMSHRAGVGLPPAPKHGVSFRH